MITEEIYKDMKKLIAQYKKQLKNPINKVEPPYLITISLTENRKYNPNYGDDRECKCGHPYHRHFDSYDNMENIGCKYCKCYDFKEKKSNKKNNDGTKTYIDKLGRTWIIEKVSLPKKRGRYNYYSAEIPDKSYGLRADLYRDILKKIDEKVEEELNQYII